MYIHICGWHISCFGALLVIRWHRRRFGPRWHRSGWWCTPAFAPPAYLGMFRGATLARKAAGHLIFANPWRVSFDHSLHLVIPGELNTPLHLFSDFGARILNQLLSFLYSGAWQPSLAILAIFKARRMSDCSSCTWPPCLAIVADMLKTSKKLVAATTVRSRYYLNNIRLHSLL